MKKKSKNISIMNIANKKPVIINLLKMITKFLIKLYKLKVLKMITFCNLYHKQNTKIIDMHKNLMKLNKKTYYCSNRKLKS